MPRTMVVHEVFTQDPAHDKLTEEHGLQLSVEMLRGWMIEDGIWVLRAKRASRSYEPRVGGLHHRYVWREAA